MSGRSIFDRANAVLDVGELIGVPARSGWTQPKGRAPCPVCGGLKCFSFKRDRFKCHRDGAGGGALDLAALIWGLSPFEAACRALNLDPTEERKAYAAETKGGGARKRTHAASTQVVSRQPPRGSSETPAIDAEIAEVIARVRAQARSGAGTLVERYFESRALPARFAGLLWFVESAPYDKGALWGRGRSFPAMLAYPEVNGVRTGGIHLTYLRADGAGKAELREGEKAKKMWGPQSDALGRPGGFPLMIPRAGRLLCVAEGIENALACAHAAGGGSGAFAAGSLNRLQGGMALNRFGRTDWRRPAPDPEKPAATMRHKGPVLICVDADMKPLTFTRKRTRDGEVIETEVLIASPERRAQVSGLLAGHWWRCAGASDVRVLTPPKGKDANDVVKERAA